MIYTVWTEGYAATGESAPAYCHGQVEATSFDEACIKLLGNSLDKDKSQPDGYGRSRNNTYSVWACACFDNETDARASFG